MSNISRRDFLKTAGVMTLAVAAAGVLAGCEGKKPTSPEGEMNQQTNDQTNANKVFGNKETATFGEYNHKFTADATLYKYYQGSDPSVYAAVVVLNATIAAGAESTAITDKANYFGSVANGMSIAGSNQLGAPTTLLTAVVDDKTDMGVNQIQQIADVAELHKANNVNMQKAVFMDLMTRYKKGAEPADGPVNTLQEFAKRNNIDKGGESVYSMVNVKDPKGEFPKSVNVMFYNSNYMAEGCEVNFKLDITKTVEVKL